MVLESEYHAEDNVSLVAHNIGIAASSLGENVSKRVSAEVPNTDPQVRLHRTRLVAAIPRGSMSPVA